MTPEAGDYKETIPAALEGSDFGISEALVGSSLDGFSRSVDVYITLRDDSLTSGELDGILRIVSPLIDQPGASELKLSFDLSPLEPADVSVAKDELNEAWGPGVRPENLSWFLTGSDSEVNATISTLRLYLKDTTR